MLVWEHPIGKRVLRVLRGLCSCSTVCRHSSSGSISGTTSGSCRRCRCTHWNSFTMVVIVGKRKRVAVHDRHGCSCASSLCLPHHVHAIAIAVPVVTQNARIVGHWLMCVMLVSVQAKGPMSKRESPRLLSRLRSPPSRCCRRTCQQGAGELNRNLQPCHWQHVVSILEQQHLHDLPRVSWQYFILSR